MERRRSGNAELTTTVPLLAKHGALRSSRWYVSPVDAGQYQVVERSLHGHLLLLHSHSWAELVARGVARSAQASWTLHLDVNQVHAGPVQVSSVVTNMTPKIP